MKYIATLILLFYMSMPETGYAQVTRKALFLGNSYTHYNNMPQMVSSMATSTGDVLVHDMYAPGGYTLDDHLSDATAIAKISANNWDYLILQEQSQLPAFATWTNNGVSTLPYLQRQQNPCGRVMYFMTWGRQNGDAGNCPVWPPVCTYQGMDSMLRLNYIAAADDYSAELSPVGAAWRYVRQHHPSINLYDADQSHPSLAGSYLAACTFYAAIFKKDPTAITFNSTLSSTQANTLKLAAKTVMYDSLTFWNRSPTTPTATFYKYMNTGANQLQFISTAKHADTYHWDFGDGATSTQQHPTHTYANNGTYTVTHTAYNCDINGTYQNSTQQTVSLCPFTPTITPANMILCPGTTDTLWTQPYSAYQWYKQDGTIVPGANRQYLVTVGSNEYYVTATQNGCTEMSQPIFVGSHNNMATWSMVEDGPLTGEDTACMGDSIIVSLRFNKPPYPHDSLISWTFNGQPIPGHRNDSLVVKTSGIYRSILRYPHCTGLDKFVETRYTFLNCGTGIATIGSNPQPLSVYPNPGTGLFTVQCRQPAIVRVADILGNTIMTMKITGNDKQVIDISNRAAGIYFLQAMLDNQQYTLKLIKE